MMKKHSNSKHPSSVDKQHFQPSLRPLAFAVALAFAGTVPNIAQATTYTVVNTDNSGAGSLRQAVIDANANSGNDTIQMSIPSGSTIYLSSEISITDSLTVFGPTPNDPSGVTLNAQGGSRHFNASFPSGSTGKFLSLNDMSLINGHTTGNSNRGGSIRTYYADLNLYHCLISGNSTAGDNAYGGGFYVGDGDATLTHSTISENTTTGNHAAGGGFFVRNATLTHSTVSGNTTAGNDARGGGFFVTNNATLIHSTVSGNTTAGNDAAGGGFYVYYNVTLTQSTVSGNSVTGSSASGGGFLVYSNLSSTTIIQSTITNNSSVFDSGGVSVNNILGTTSVKNSILSGNIGPEGNFNERLSIPSNLNIESSLFADPLSEIGGSSTGVVYDPSNDPKLWPLLPNGGSTLTHNPMSIVSSQIIDAGNNTFAAGLTNDQRGAGYSRIYNTTVDMGAVEWRQNPNFTVSNTQDAGAGSLRRAVFNTNSHPGADTIQMSIPSGSTINLSTELLITDSVAIVGPIPNDPTGVTLNALGNSRHLNTSFPSGSTGKFLTLHNMSLINAHTTTAGSGDGGSIRIRFADLNLNYCLISGNSTVGDNAHGGGFYVASGNATLTHSTISGNSTAGNFSNGGGFYMVGGTATLTNSTISGNSTAGIGAGGGGFNVYQGNVTLINSTVSGNSTSGNNADGGGFYVRHNIALTQSTVSGNSTTGSNADGGGFFVRTNSVSLLQSTVTANNASSGAGGISFDSGPSQATASIKNSILSGNIGPEGNIDNRDSNPAYLSVKSSLFADPLSEIGTNTGAYYDPSNDPKLGPLQDNGGPTLTHKPLIVPTSQILNSGNNAFATAFINDQRGAGFSRIHNTTVDMGAVEWHPNPNEVLVRRDMAKNIILAIEGPAYTPPIANNPIYNDVQAGDVNADWIAELKSRGFTEGCATNKFCPNMVVTKEQIAKVHLKAKLLDPPMPTANVFVDVSGPYTDFFGNTIPGAFAWDYITKMRDQGYSTGCEDGFGFVNGIFANGTLFCPDNPVTREWFNSLLNTLP